MEQGTDGAEGCFALSPQHKQLQRQGTGMSRNSLSRKSEGDFWTNQALKRALSDDEMLMRRSSVDLDGILKITSSRRRSSLGSNTSISATDILLSNESSTIHNIVQKALPDEMRTRTPRSSAGSIDMMHWQPSDHERRFSAGSQGLSAAVLEIDGFS